jgi:hypothetical protein
MTSYALMLSLSLISSFNDVTVMERRNKTTSRLVEDIGDQPASVFRILHFAKVSTSVSVRVIAHQIFEICHSVYVRSRKYR